MFRSDRFREDVLARLCRQGVLLLAMVAWLIPLSSAGAETAEGRLKVAIVGMVHGHVNGWLRSDYQDRLDLVGIYETDDAVKDKYRERYDLDESLFFDDLETLLEETQPEAAWVFSSTYDHERLVEICAPHGVDLIVEKPLAVSLQSARRMAALAREHGVHLLTNLETSWYPSLHHAYEFAVEEGELGKITKIVSHFGHEGPVGIRVQPEFLEWLTDPVLNGGGASADFGCYGANIITWMMGNERPISVTAVFQSNMPDVYPKVDDNATIILEYPGMQGIIQASWDWPFSRKDVHVYGRSGILRTIDPTRYDLRLERNADPKPMVAEPVADLNPIAYFTSVIRGEEDPAGSLSSLENNLIVSEIMAAAKQSAESGQKVYLAQ